MLAITGGTGFVGQALLKQALLKAAEGPALRALTRSLQAPRSGVTWVQGDLDNGAALAELVAGAEAVVHIAGVVKAQDIAEFEAGNARATLNMIEAAKAAGVPRFVLVSSLAAREPDLSAYGASKARAELLVKASGLDWTIVRPPAVFGPGDKDLFEMFRMAKWGVVPAPAGRASLIHVADLARLLLALVPAGETVSHQTYEPDDGKVGGWDNAELARTIGWAMGRRVRVPALSAAMLQRAAKWDGWIRRSRARMTFDRASYSAHPDWVIDPAARPPAGLWQPQMPTRDSLRATAQWYRAAGWL